MNKTRTHYRSLVIAGLGSVGQGVLTLGQDWFNLFEKVAGLDCHRDSCQNVEKHNITVQQGDICSDTFLDELSQSLPEPILLVNLCNGIDTVQLRKKIQDKPIGYIDICESEMPGNKESRFSLGMPYTNQACHGDYPHWICQGINPGLVEYMVRELMHQMNPDGGDFTVTIFENDQLSARDRSGKIAVGWCPEDLVEEMMVCPSLEYTNGQMIERQKPGAEGAIVNWQGDLIPARLVGHEDVWNLARLDDVTDVKFLYSLHSDVMTLFEMTPEQAMKKLTLTESIQMLYGLERIVVTVEQPDSNRKKSLLWQTDHAFTYRCLGINAVQFQTAASVLISILMMQQTHLGTQTGTWNASTLPLDDSDWHRMDEFMQKIGIVWQPVDPDYVRPADFKQDVSASQTMDASS